MIVGFDFDNTIIDYNNLFGLVALEKNLILKPLAHDKNSVKQYLINANKEDEWTKLQGEVYGSRVLEANLYEGIIDIFKYLSNNSHKIYIVSHKTKFPYLGKKVDLHKSALKFIIANNILNKKDIKLTKDDIFFETSIKDKIERIENLKCDIFVDDLESILNLLPDNIIKILFLPKSSAKKSNYKVIKKWNELKNFI